jgi:hypothetical protein
MGRPTAVSVVPAFAPNAGHVGLREVGIVVPDVLGVVGLLSGGAHEAAAGVVVVAVGDGDVVVVVVVVGEGQVGVVVVDDAGGDVVPPLGGGVPVG